MRKSGARRKRHTNNRRGPLPHAVAIVSNMSEQLNQPSHVAIMVHAYKALDDLAKGQLSIEGFYMLHGVNTAAHCLIVLIHENGTDRVKSAMTESVGKTYEAAEALAGIGERYAKTGRFGASGDQLKAVTGSVSFFDSLTEGAPTGLVLRAIRQAADIIDRFDAAATKAGQAKREPKWDTKQGEAAHSKHQ